MALNASIKLFDVVRAFAWHRSDFVCKADALHPFGQLRQRFGDPPRDQRQRDHDCDEQREASASNKAKIEAVSVGRIRPTAFTHLPSGNRAENSTALLGTGAPG